MSQQGKRKIKNLLDLAKIESLLVYFMRILNSCAV